ncbi:tRNA-dihydrouridine(47) synthase [NAD(P)(+)]-like isoform X1 [Lacerta agilis]|uniref:tRNA-dihydrouridine(47) synthase [NAD(P)(+)]-like isoform X1 n=1 Tax=Lacerta agilis TaxID=80427 RepID=UPI00141A1205|nr:tRNA-dihydrouridine(47) synthase [NAD(P)(+)]-like isoform X1 [Lacerta agilis]
MEAAGVAPIRAQYLSTKEKFHTYLDREGEVTNEKDGDTLTAEDSAENNTGGGLNEPPAKLQKLGEDGSNTEEKSLPEEESRTAKEPRGQKRARGQNKGRPCMKPTHYEKNRLCPSVVQERAEKCFFGSRCRFLHSVKEYMATKPPDLGDSCILFQMFGRCMYGVTCRFAAAHLGKDYENVINEGLLKQREGKPPAVRNSLDKDLQQQLRKKKFPFDKSNQYLGRLAKPNHAKGAGSQAAVAHPTVGREAADSSGSPGSVDLKAAGEEVAKVGSSSPEAGPTVEEPESASQPLAAMESALKTSGVVTDEDLVKLRPCEKRKLDLREKLYLAPLTTLEGAFPDTMTKCAELLNRTIEVDFVDVNVGCPIDLIYNKGGGCGLMNRPNKFEQIVRGMNYVLDVPLTVKIRTGVQEKTNLAHKLIPSIREWGASMVTLHGRSREQRYTKAANWEYIAECAKIASPMPLFGNGDILSFEDANQAMQSGVSGIMIARGALIKPWIFTEIKEQRHWDISSGERLDILRDFTNYGLEHWGSDTQGVEKTRKFLLEWLSFLCRYIPAGLLERLPQRINERPPYYMGRDYLETLMASQNVGDWIKISEMLLGPVPASFTFLPKHKANSYK